MPHFQYSLVMSSSGLIKSKVFHYLHYLDSSMSFIFKVGSCLINWYIYGFFEYNIPGQYDFFLLKNIQPIYTHYSNSPAFLLLLVSKICKYLLHNSIGVLSIACEEFLFIK